MKLLERKKRTIKTQMKSVHVHSHTQAHTQELDYIHELTKCFYFYLYN